ncbi:Probable aspartic proteinase GIP2 [Linum perenne]
MALHYNSSYLIFSCLLIFSIAVTSQAQPSFRPKALVLPVSKDPSTLQYIAQINQRTPLVPVKLTVDLGGQYLWVDCEQGYVSSSYKPARCRSAQCSLANSKSCNNNTCGLLPGNTVTETGTSGELGQDVVSIQSTDGSKPGQFVKVPNLIFTCGSTFLLDGLADGVKGMAGLGRTKISIPSQFSASFSFDRKFAICLSSSSKGVVFFGDGPYVLLPNIDVSKSLTYTPTVLETSIHKALTNAFAKQLSKVPKVAAVAPFTLCFNSTAIGSTRVGPAVPQIDLVLQSSSVIWRIFGANSMVEVKKDVLCLGFVDGGFNPRTSIVIGGHQLEDNLLQFDLATSRLLWVQPTFGPTIGSYLPLLEPNWS